MSRLGLPAFAGAMFLLLFSLGFVMANCVALALSRHPGRAGSASALIGVNQFLTGAAVAPLVGIGAGGTLSMAVVVAVCVVAAVVVFLAVARQPSGEAARLAARTPPEAQPLDIH